MQLPASYAALSLPEVRQRILKIRADRGSRLMILGHHYQRANIIEVVDKIGDSFALAAAASKSTAQDIVFCGVRFMAESAAILCRDDQRVYHPEPEAGCPMADMAPMDSVEFAWQELQARADLKGRRIIPVTYMNSHAPLKSFTGKHGGVVCTSSNADKCLKWAFSQGDMVFFFPDQHLGRNTGKTMGFSQEQMPVWYPSRVSGGLPTDLSQTKIILWNGHCPVHMKFTVRDIDFVRQHFPGCKVAVHPECEKEVVDAADAHGSTNFLVEWVKSQPPKSMLFIGTEQMLVERLKKENPDKRVEYLTRSLCPTMYLVNLHKLLYTLENMGQCEPVPISGDQKAFARKALNQMLELA